MSAKRLTAAERNDLANTRIVSIEESRAALLNLAPHANELQNLKAKREARDAAIAAGDDYGEKKDMYIGDLMCSIFNGVARVGVRGVVVPTRSFWTWAGYETAAEDIESLPRMLPDDIKTLIVEYDSPGGLVEGVPEAAAALYGLRKRMVTVAFARFACSAAYYLASQQDYVFMMPSGTTGSVGVKAMHVSFAGKLEQDGIEVTEFGSPERKTEFSPWKPLSEDTKKRMQARIEKMRKQFEKAVAKGRDMKLEDIQENFGRGAPLDSDEAMAAGAVDKVMPYEQFLAGKWK